MSTIVDNLNTSIANRLHSEREARGWSMADLATHSGVSRAMISKIERGESSPTTTVLGRLCGAFGLTLSTFLTRVEDQAGQLIRAAEQQSWTDPDSGCVRTLVSPSAGGAIEIITVDLPPDARVSFPASIYAVFRQSIWILEGQLALTEGENEHLLNAGDCIELGPPSPCIFHNPTTKPCRYMVAAGKRD